MYSTKTLLAAASLAVLSAAGLGTASAAPWDHHGDRHDFARHERMEHRAFVEPLCAWPRPCASTAIA